LIRLNGRPGNRGEGSGGFSGSRGRTGFNGWREERRAAADEAVSEGFPGTFTLWPLEKLG